MKEPDLSDEKGKRLKIDDLTKYLAGNLKETIDRMGNPEEQKPSSSEDPTQILAASLNLLSLRLDSKMWKKR